MNKYLEKLAYLKTEVIWPKNQMIAGGLIGGVAGGLLGSRDKVREYKNGKYYHRTKTKNEKTRDTILTALSGAVAGVSLTAHPKVRIVSDGRAGGRNYYDNANTFSRTRSHKDILHDLQASGGFKTKAEASKHYKKMAMKHHPDRGGDQELMKKINKAWDEYKAHPDGFEKLAGYRYLEKLREQII